MVDTDTDAVVVVVDDDRDLADLYAAWLADSHTVRTAYGGREALGELDASVDVVLLDRRMPGLDGEQVLAAIRERELGCQVALVTSVEMDYDSLPLGFDDYVTKPVTKPALETLVESLCIRLDYSQKLQRYFALVSKRVALQTAKEPEEFADHPEVRRLDDRIDELREEIDELLGEFSEDDYRAMFGTLSPEEESFRGLG